MSDTTVSLRKKINTAIDLQSVVRTMKASAASSIGQYEKSVAALTDYYRAVQLGLHVCLQQSAAARLPQESNFTTANVSCVIVFGSDQGLVGQFNDVVSDFALKTITIMPVKPLVWAVGERAQSLLTEAGIVLAGAFNVPSSVNAIPRLIEEILVASKAADKHTLTELHLFYNRLSDQSSYAPMSEQLLPLDEGWRQRLIETKWPTRNLPEVLSGSTQTLSSFIREYLFVSLFRACAQSLASENASRLAAMQRADKNVDQLLEDLNRRFYRLRQSRIDEELFDVVSGFEALKHPL